MTFDIRTDKPVVSVSVITYNNEPYIRECLGGILSQKTDFPFEVCIGEDGSTDGTREICIELAEKYPEKIRLFLRTQKDAGREKYQSQGVYNYIMTTRECRGEFVAFCDGDDSWTHEHKLQHQVQILKSDENVALVHSDYDKVSMVTGARIDSYNRVTGSEPEVSADRDRAIVDLLLGKYTVAASSVVARTSDILDIFKSCKDLFLELPMGDTQTWCELLRRGSFYYLDEALALYRVTKESTSNSLSALKRFEFVNGTADLGLKLIPLYNLPKEELIAYKVKSCNRYSMLSGNTEELEELHASYTASFCRAESMLYRINRIPAFRALFAVFFQKRYINNHLKL